MVKYMIKAILNGLRLIRCRLFLNTIGKGSQICKGAYLTHCEIGDYCYLGMYSYFNHVKMGNYCSIAGNVTIGAMEHDYTDVSTSTFLSAGGYDDRTTNIGNDVWIGAQCVIRQGISIGDGAVIGANSFVNKDIPPFSIVFGTPAKVYKKRFDEKKVSEIYASNYWALDPLEAKKSLKDKWLKKIK